MIKLFLGGFPLDSTELELVQLVSPYLPNAFYLETTGHRRGNNEVNKT